MNALRSAGAKDGLVLLCRQLRMARPARARMGRSSCPKARNSMPFSERCCAFRILYHCLYYVYAHSAADLSRTYVGFTEDLRQRCAITMQANQPIPRNTFRGFSSPTSHSRTVRKPSTSSAISRRLPVSHSPANAYERSSALPTVHLRQGSDERSHSDFDSPIRPPDRCAISVHDSGSRLSHWSKASFEQDRRIALGPARRPLAPMLRTTGKITRPALL